MNAEMIARRFDKARREGRTWRFACPLCGKPKAWARDRHSEIKLGCWGCSDWKELRRIAFGDERPIKTAESLGRGKWWAKTADEAAAAFSEVRLAQTLALWRRAHAIEGTLAARYLRSRGLDPDRFDLQALRFSSMQWHWPTRSTWPALLALVSTHDGRELSVHQTFLSLDGAGKAAIEKARLYRAGLPIAGGGVWFPKAEPKGEFVVGEGIETTLSAMALYGAAAGCAALSASGLATLILPASVKRVRICADHDVTARGLVAARDACRRWRAEGRAVVVSMPERIGDDMNDVLMRQRGLL
jgi:hypothetical protein